jgi:3-hydroxybutyryl-CoA dehydrogenase
MRIQSIAVVGAGYMGGGIAQYLAARDVAVRLVDADQQTATDAVARVLEESDRWASQGLLTPEGRASLERNLSAAGSIDEGCSGAQLVVEAVPEAVELKHDVLAQIERATDPGTIVATNTSAIPIRVLRSALSRPENFLGTHWFNPAAFVPLVELIGDGDVIERAGAFLRSVGKVTVHVDDRAGFVGNRLQFALYREGVLMIEQGAATADEIDRVVTNSFGSRLPFIGPIAAGDISGLDVYLGAFRALEAEYGDRFSPPESLVRRVEAGDLGLKSGGGYRDLLADQPADVAEFRDRALHAVAALRGTLAAHARRAQLD